jgi:hypothetical protein
MRNALDAFAARMARHPAVQGIVILGSGANASLTDASDYDVLVVLDQPVPPLFVALTSVGGRLTDVIFVSPALIEQGVLGDEHSDEWRLRVAYWLVSGDVVFDRNGIIGNARTQLGGGSTEPRHSAGAIYARWFSVNYDLAQTRRIATSTDPVYAMTVDLRLLFGLHQLWMAYFAFRQLPWRGDKHAIRYLLTHDGPFLETFRRCLAETDRERKVALYGELVAMVTEPVGGVWPEGGTHIQVQPEAANTPSNLEAAERLWAELNSA